MTATAHGRLCAKCDKELIDFTGMSEDEIRAYHLRHPGTCGLHSLSQFHRPASRLAAAAAAAAIGLTVPELAQAVLQVPALDIRQAQIEPVDSIVVRGTVVDSVMNRPLAGAQIVVTGTRFGTITDRNGEFRIVIPSETPLPIKLKVQLIGYEAREVSVTSAESLANMKFTLSQVFIGIREVIVTRVERPPTPKAPSYLWQLWRAVRAR